MHSNVKVKSHTSTTAVCPYDVYRETLPFLISDFRRDLNIVYFLLGISPTSNCSWPTFRNSVSVPSSKAGCTVYTQPLKMELIQSSETSANYNLMPGKYPEENIQ